jgi:hypothetical protein
MDMDTEQAVRAILMGLTNSRVVYVGMTKAQRLENQRQEADEIIAKAKEAQPGGPNAQ